MVSFAGYASWGVYVRVLMRGRCCNMVADDQ